MAAVLDDVRLAVLDWRHMRQKCRDLIDELERKPPQLPKAEVKEGLAFLEWLEDNNFTFLGYREYSFSGKGGKAVSRILPDSGRQDVRLVICGTGSLRAALEEQAAFLGISNAVTFAGQVSNDEVARYVAVADVFALPSLLEALPTVAVEALASGTPVVSADHPGGVELHDIFGDDVVVVPKRDAPALAHGLTEALNAGRSMTRSRCRSCSSW